MEGYVRVDEFMNHLTEQGMVIVRRDLVMSQKDYEMHELKMLQEKALRKKWLSFSEVIKAQLTPYTSRTGLINALEKRPNYEKEVKVVRGVYRVLTSVIKEMRYE
jgi:hypothetical protein